LDLNLPFFTMETPMLDDSASSARPMIELLHIRDLSEEEVVAVSKNMVRDLLENGKLTFRQFSAQPVLVDGVMRHRLQNAGGRGNATLLPDRYVNRQLLISVVILHVGDRVATCIASDF
jgi:hypothetical protein